MIAYPALCPPCGVQYSMPEFLYIHIPFCARKCIYCDFLSLPYDQDLARRYTHALCRELELKKTFATALTTVFVGGGTPTILPDACLEQIFSVIRKNYALPPGAEVTVEANPGTVTREKADMLLSLGVNRISLGVQTFSDAELKILGRIHTAEDAITSAGILQAAGLKNLSLDLMYGIPGQTIETWKDSLSKANSLFPKHISAYELTPEKGTQLKRMLDSENLSMPGEELILAMSAIVIDTLAEAGFQHYEISNYALPGHHCIHNMNYWNRGEYLAAGAGAHAFLKGCRSRNTDSVMEYIRDLDDLRIPEAESVPLSHGDGLREFIMLGLRKIEGIRLKDADDLNLDLRTAAHELIEDGFTDIIGNRLRLTRKGLRVANTVIVKLQQNLKL